MDVFRFRLISLLTLGVFLSALFWSLIRAGVNEGLGVPPFSFLNFLLAFSFFLWNLRLHCKASSHSLVRTSHDVI